MGVASLGSRGTFQDWSAVAVCLLPGPVFLFSSRLGGPELGSCRSCRACHRMDRSFRSRAVRTTLAAVWTHVHVSLAG